MTGVSLLQNFPSLPPVIITTAYPDYAVESYKFDVIDYLLKPVALERFVKAVGKARDFRKLSSQQEHAGGDAADYCFIKCDKSYEKLYYREINYVEAMLNYVVIHTADKKFISYLTLKGVEEQLPVAHFKKINKSCIVNLGNIRSIEGNSVFAGTTELSVSRSVKDELMEVLVNNKLLKR